MSQQTFPEFVATLTERDDPIGDFARDFRDDGQFNLPRPEWEQLERYLRGHGAIREALAAAQDTWELWAGRPAVEDDDEGAEEDAEWYADEFDEEDEEEDDDEEWLDDETYMERLGNKPAGHQPRTGYDDSDLDGWLPGEA